MDQQPERLTLAALTDPQQDIWALVDRPLPEKPDAELLQTAFSEFRQAAGYAGDVASGYVSNPDPSVDWTGRAEAADTRAWEADSRLNELQRSGETREIGPRDFGDAARAALNTPQDQRERDLAEVINHFEATAGTKDSPERAAFQKEQAALSDQITREPDPAQRAELRAEREAQGHIYAADLADQIGAKVLSIGQLETAQGVHQLAGLHREIAGELRSPTSPDRGEPQADAREQFANAAADIGREVLGRTAETVMVAEGPNPQRPENTVNRGVTVGMGPGGPVLTEINQDRPDVQPGAALRSPSPLSSLDAMAEVVREAEKESGERVGPERTVEAQPVAYEIDHEAAGVEARAAYTRSSTDKETQQVEEAALRSPSPTSARSSLDAMAEVVREAENENEGQGGPERPEGPSVGTAAGKYAVLGR